MFSDANTHRAGETSARKLGENIRLNCIYALHQTNIQYVSNRCRTTTRVCPGNITVILESKIGVGNGNINYQKSGNIAQDQANIR